MLRFPKIVVLMLMILFCLPAIAQEKDSSKLKYKATLNDSIVYKKIEEVNVYPRKGRNLNYRRYSRIVAKIRKVYPFAKDAAAELEKYNELYLNATSEREKRKYVRKVEKDLFAKHEAKLRRFTVSEGQYLMLLIDRETGNSSFAIIKDVKGGVPAIFWQGVAKIFNNDLKRRYDPIYHHYVIEQIVQMIEMENAKKDMVNQKSD